MTRGKSAGRDSLDVNRVCPPSVHVSVESHAMSDSQQTTSVGLALTVSWTDWHRYGENSNNSGPKFKTRILFM